MSTINTGHIPVPLRRSSRFPTLRCKVPRPRRCSDEHFLVKPFGGVLVPGISPDPCACCASAPSQPQSLLIRGVSPNPCGAQVAFRLCRGKVPRPRRSADADSLVEPFGGVLVRGLRRCLRRASPLLRCLRHLAAAPPRHIAAPPAVADNTLTIKQKSTLPVSKTGSSSNCVHQSKALVKIG